MIKTVEQNNIQKVKTETYKKEFEWLLKFQ